MHLNLGKLMVMNVGFLLLWSSFDTSEGLLGTLLKENDFGDLGFYSLGIFNLVQTLACFFAVPIVKRAGFRASFVMGGLTYTLFVSSFVLPAYHAQNPTSSAWFADRTFIWSIVLTTGALNGVGSAVLWVANGNYISECATNANKGLFNSIFWVFLMFSAIIGYAAAAFLINDCKQTTYWFVMTVICLLATLTFMFITKPDKHPTKKTQRDLAITASGKDSILLSGG